MIHLLLLVIVSFFKGREGGEEKAGVDSLSAVEGIISTKETLLLLMMLINLNKKVGAHE